MRPLPTFHQQSTELLNNVELARRFRETDEEGLLFADWKKLGLWLKSELPTIAPSLGNWSRPVFCSDDETVTLTIEPGASWTRDGDSAICLYFSVSNSVYDDDYRPNVGLWVADEWPLRDDFCAFIGKHRPEGFGAAYDDGRPERESPFWRDLPLRDFQSDGLFDTARFVRAIGEAFETLATIRPAVDQFLAERTPAPPIVPKLGKAIILDLEGYDEVVEVGLILVAYDVETRELAGELDRYEGLRCPAAGAKLPEKITAKMLAGKKLVDSTIERFIASADTIISHGNGFDRPRFQKMFSSSKERRWLCSVNDLPWTADYGFEGANLDYLCTRHGIRNRDSHRALPDAEALLHILAQKRGSVTYFSELLRSKDLPQPKVQAAVVGKRSR